MNGDFQCFRNLFKCVYARSAFSSFKERDVARVYRREPGEILLLLAAYRTNNSNRFAVVHSLMEVGIGSFLALPRPNFSQREPQPEPQLSTESRGTSAFGLVACV